MSWLKTLRLHKYYPKLSAMGYHDMITLVGLLDVGLHSGEGPFLLLLSWQNNPKLQNYEFKFWSGVTEQLERCVLNLTEVMIQVY